MRLWFALGAFALGLVAGSLGRSLDLPGLDLTAGVLFILAILFAILALPWWRQWLPPLEPMPGLFQRVPNGGRWCTRCGTPAPAKGACGVCGHAKPVRQAKPKKPKAKKEASGKRPAKAGARKKGEHKPRRS